MSHLGNCLKDARNANARSLRAIAEIADLRYETLRLMEKGRRVNPTVQTLLAIAHALDIDPARVFEAAALDHAGVVLAVAQRKTYAARAASADSNGRANGLAH